MKKIFLFLLLSTTVITVSVAQENRPNSNDQSNNRSNRRHRKLRRAQPRLLFRPSYLPVKTQDATNAINDLHKAIDNAGSWVRPTLGIPLNYLETYSYNDFEQFCNASQHHSIALYPAVDNGRFRLLVRLVDIYGEPQGNYLQQIDTSVAKAQIKEFKRISILQNSLVAGALLPNKFYDKNNLYYSTRIDKEALLFWMKNSKIDKIQFYPSLHTEPDGNKYISIVSRGLYNSGLFFSVRVNGVDYSYFNITYPCPPPRDCK